MKKKIFINILILLFLIFSAEFIARCIYARGASNPLKYLIYEFNLEHKLYYHIKDIDYLLYWNFREIEQGKKNGIILFGCSFTYGDSLEPNQTFSHILNKKTDRTIYNLGISGGAKRSSLYS